MLSPVSKVLIVSAVLVSLAGRAPADASAAGKSAAPSKHHPSSRSSKSHRRSRKGAWKHHGQQNIQPERASAIQEALIRENYLSGEPSGKWDDRTQAAMARYQADHGWQSKVTPDSRALIKLGLGPDYSEKNMMLLPKAVSEPVAASAATSASTTSKQR